MAAVAYTPVPPNGARHTAMPAYPRTAAAASTDLVHSLPLSVENVAMLQRLVQTSRVRRRVVPKFDALSWSSPNAMPIDMVFYEADCVDGLAPMAGSPKATSSSDSQYRSRGKRDPKHDAHGSHGRRKHDRRRAEPFLNKTTRTWISTHTTTTIVLPSATVQVVPVLRRQSAPSAMGLIADEGPYMPPYLAHSQCRGVPSQMVVLSEGENESSLSDQAHRRASTSYNTVPRGGTVLPSISTRAV